MLTQEQRRKLEAEWSSDDRSILAFARLLKCTVLFVLVLGLVWIGGSGNGPGTAQQASAANAPYAAPPADAGSAMQASRQAFDARQAQWDRSPATRQQKSASRSPAGRGE